MDDRMLSQQLQALEAQVVVTGAAPARPTRRAPRMRTVLGAAMATLIVAGGVAVAGGALNGTARPGAFNPGQPLHCSGIAAMTPVAADRWLRDHGYDVTWQVEDKTPGVAKGQATSYQSATPPDTGLIAGAVITSKSAQEVIVVVETGAGATGTDDCQG